MSAIEARAEMTGTAEARLSDRSDVFGASTIDPHKKEATINVGWNVGRAERQGKNYAYFKRLSELMAEETVWCEPVSSLNR
jgi:hypothetical protein